MTATLDRLVDGTAVHASARDWVQTHGWPTTRDEAWRYAPLAAITTAVETATARPTGDATAGLLLSDLPGGPRIVVVDGRYRPDLSTPAAPAATIAFDPPLDPFSTATTIDTAGDVDGFDGFDAANQAACAGTLRIGVAAVGGASQPLRIHVVQLTTGGPAAHPRTEVTVAPDARVELIETYRAAPEAALTNASTRVELGERAHVVHVRVIEAPAATAHTSRVQVVTRDGAAFVGATLTTGGGAVRQRLGHRLDGTAATATLTGLTMPLAGAHHDTTVAVEHASAHTTSRQRYVAVVADRGRSSFTGRVTVAAGTVGTDADQQHRALLLGPSARADARPWLQIDADDVACSHGATVGRLDDDAVFYLRSRGIPEQDARAMLIDAFARGALAEAVPPGPAQEWLTAAVAAAVDGSAPRVDTNAGAARPGTREAQP